MKNKEQFWLVPTDSGINIRLVESVEDAEKYAEELMEDYKIDKFYIISNLTNKVVRVGEPRKQVTRIDWSVF